MLCEQKLCLQCEYLCAHSSGIRVGSAGGSWNLPLNLFEQTQSTPVPKSQFKVHDRTQNISFCPSEKS